MAFLVPQVYRGDSSFKYKYIEAAARMVCLWRRALKNFFRASRSIPTSSSRVGVSFRMIVSPPPGISVHLYLVWAAAVLYFYVVYDYWLYLCMCIYHLCYGYLL